MALKAIKRFNETEKYKIISHNQKMGIAYNLQAGTSTTRIQKLTEN
jgi:hypothetical protein